MSERASRIGLPILVLALVVLAWDLVVRLFAIPPFVLPSPGLVLATLISDRTLLGQSLLVTLTLTLEGFLLAAIGGVALAIAFNQWRRLESALYPYAVILQVTPIVAVAPLIIIWIKDPTVSMVICASLVALFPVIANTTLGLRSVDPDLQSYFRLNHASRAQTLLRLRIPSALPYFFGGLRISSGLALIGAVVAEFVAGTGGAETGLAFRILEAGYRLQIPRLFAALVLLSFSGIAIYWILSLASWLLLRRWHESALPREE
jgi:NitT/TauT family transport system permease protein